MAMLKSKVPFQIKWRPYIFTILCKEISFYEAVVLDNSVYFTPPTPTKTVRKEKMGSEFVFMIDPKFYYEVMVENHLSLTDVKIKITKKENIVGDVLDEFSCFATLSSLETLLGI